MKRLQFELSEKRVEELDALVEQTGSKTRVQLINAAIALFEWAIREREAGRIIASIDEKLGRYKEIEMAEFPSLAENPDALGAILGQLEGYLETSEQEEAFTTLANVLVGANSNHPNRFVPERTSGERENRENQHTD